MRRSVYRSIVETIESEEFDYQECLKTLTKKFPAVRHDSLCGILSQEHQKRVKRSFFFQTSASKRKENYKLFTKRLAQQRNNSGKKQPGANSRGIIVDIARQNRFSATLTAKALLVDHLQEKGNGKPPTKQQISQLMRDTNLIEDSDVAVEVFKATLRDEGYGYLAECTKRSIGAEYERRLKRHLRQLNISYQDEHDLRAAGYDKTPDVKLDVPISVNGSVVNWIESKALFGDEESHTAYLNDQLWSYWNRFGPGLVIYWCGYLRHLEWSTEHGILVRDGFPSPAEIVCLDPLTEALFDKGFDTDPDDDDEDDNDDDDNDENITDGDDDAESVVAAHDAKTADDDIAKLTSAKLTL